MVRRQRSALVALSLLAAGALTAHWWRGGFARLSGTGEPAAGTSRPAESPLPRIALDRLARSEPAEPGASRDVFRFERPKPPSAPPVAVPAVAPPAAPVFDASPPPPPTTTLPPYGVKYIGSVERSGLRVAVLLSDERKEVLTGREGDVVANRLKIVKIGFESVEVQDLGSERVRRIPLRGN
jgi:hypothetical protein